MKLDASLSNWNMFIRMIKHTHFGNWEIGFKLRRLEGLSWNNTKTLHACTVISMIRNMISITRIIIIYKGLLNPVFHCSALPRGSISNKFRRLIEWASSPLTSSLQHLHVTSTRAQANFSWPLTAYKWHQIHPPGTMQELLLQELLQLMLWHSDGDLARFKLHLACRLPLSNRGSNLWIGPWQSAEKHRSYPYTSLVTSCNILSLHKGLWIRPCQWNCNHLVQCCS